MYGPSGSNVGEFFTTSDFRYSYDITEPSDYINQCPDIAIDKNNTIHVVWQSSRNGYWEIYYANSYDLFVPIRITKSESKSLLPKISINAS
jgi:hypothetical protein